MTTPEPLQEQPLPAQPEQPAQPVVAEQVEQPGTAEQPQIPQAEVLPNVEEQRVPVEKEGFLDETIDSLKRTLRLSKKPKTTIPQVRDELTVQVEHILSDGLVDAYKAMTTVQQQEFKIKGEQTAWEIRQLLRGTHVHIKKLFKLIFEWLKLLPGVNKFFLEQEAKIKADKILSLKNRDRL